MRGGGAAAAGRTEDSSEKALTSESESSSSYLDAYSHIKQSEKLKKCQLTWKLCLLVYPPSSESLSL